MCVFSLFGLQKENSRKSYRANQTKLEHWHDVPVSQKHDTELERNQPSHQQRSNSARTPGWSFLEPTLPILT